MWHTWPISTSGCLRFTRWMLSNFGKSENLWYSSMNDKLRRQTCVIGSACTVFINGNEFECLKIASESPLIWSSALSLSLSKWSEFAVENQIYINSRTLYSTFISAVTYRSGNQGWSCSRWFSYFLFPNGCNLLWKKGKMNRFFARMSEIKASFTVLMAASQIRTAWAIRTKNVGIGGCIAAVSI